MSEGKTDNGGSGADLGTSLSKALLAEYGGTWDEFIGTCEDMASEIATKNPYGADSDGLRMKCLIAIAREWYTANIILTRTAAGGGVKGMAANEGMRQ